jgi:hypothetical protein
MGLEVRHVGDGRSKLFEAALSIASQLRHPRTS